MKRSAFTMMELMIAMGILAVGMAMSASLFPTAAKEANTAIGSAIGQTIAENGLAMGQLAFRSEDHTSNPKAAVKETWFKMSADSGRIDEYAQNGTCYDTSILSSSQMRYPTGDENSKYGFVLAAHKVDGSDAYQIVSTAYRKQDASNKVDWDYIFINTSGTATNEVTIRSTTHGDFSDGSQAYVNSPLILFRTGTIATIIAQSGVGRDTTLTLDRKIKIPSRDTVAMILRERKGSSSNYETRSPAIYTMTVTTALDD